MDDATGDVAEALELTLESLDGMTTVLLRDGVRRDARDDVASRTLEAVERIAEAMVRLERRVAELAERVESAVDPPAPAAGPVRAAFWAPPARLRSVAG